MRLFTAILARNEAGGDRFLRDVISRCNSFSDGVLVLDDGSTDGTVGLARELGAVVRERPHQPAAWGNESSARKELWDFALEYATGWDDWILIADADHEVRGDIRGLCKSWECNAWALALFDCWSKTEYRSDQFWQAHTVPRPWLYAPHRVPSGWEPQWSTRGVHPGHAPQNFPYALGVADPSSFYILHWGWSTEQARQQKYTQYMTTAHQLSEFERAHVESILV